MATERGTNCIGVFERLRLAPGLRWARQAYTASGMRATVIDAHDGTEYDLELRPKADQWPPSTTPAPMTERTTIIRGEPDEHDRQMFLKPECWGCGHAAHVGGECQQLLTFTKTRCECSVHEGART